MTADSRRRREGGRIRRSAGGSLPQLPWRDVRNPYPPLDMLSSDQVEAIHRTSLRILRELGIELMSPRARSLLRAYGAETDEATGNVRLDEAVVERALATAPPSFTLTPRNPSRRVTLGGNHLVFGLVAGPPYVHDFVRGRRAGNHRDYCDFIRLAQYFNAVHVIGNQVCAPVELPAGTRHLDCYLANLLLSDRAYHCTAIGSGRARDGIAMMAIARGIPVEAMAASPGVITIISVNSPRRFDEAMADGLMTMAEHGQPVVITPFTLMGAMAPVTLAAALAQQNAEALFGVVCAGRTAGHSSNVRRVHVERRHAFRGSRVRYARERQGERGQRTARATYRLPYRTSNASASNVADVQGPMRRR